MSHVLRRFLPVLTLLACYPLAAQDQDQTSSQHVGRVLDWSYHHVILSGGLRTANLEAAETDPRILFHLAERNLVRSKGDRGREATDLPPRPTRKGGRKIDWSVSLGQGNVAANMYPAKYSFDINATPSCLNDYVVFGLNIAGVTAGQANLVGIRNLYSGIPIGLCGANPSVGWAYNGTTVAGGRVLTSPVISLDGTKIAYVESAAGSAVFHVLTWKSGEGASATSAAAPTLNGACNATSSCLKSLTFSAASSDTLASPWVDYASDKAFVGSDNGRIYRISCVFRCALNTNPAVDWTFTLPVAGTGGASATPNGPVYHAQTGHVIVGDQLGELWTITASGAAPTLFAGPVMIGGGGCTIAHPPGRTGTPGPGTNCTASGGSFGIPDSIILDGSAGKVFAFSGNDGTVGASAVVAQLNENLTGLVRTHVGFGSRGNTTTNVDVHAGAFDNNYFGATPGSGRLFLCATGPADTSPWHYWIGFTSYPTMNSTPTGSLQRIATAGVACAPSTELYNPNLTFLGLVGHHDLLISGVMSTAGYVSINDISTGAVVSGQRLIVNYSGGVSGSIVDNVSTLGHTSSVYFSTQTGNTNVGTCIGNIRCAVKLTQLDLL